MNIRDLLPLWRQIELAIKEEIATGELKPGDELDPVASLATNYGVNLHTVRRALKELDAAGLVKVRNGRRAVVGDNIMGYSIGSSTRFTENVEKHNREASTVLVRSALLAAPGRARKLLKLEPGEQVALLCTRGEADKVPLSYGRNYLPTAVFGDAHEAVKRLGSTAAVMAERGFDKLKREGTMIIARMPTEEEANQLKQARNEPVLVSEFLDIDETGRPVRYGHTAFAASRVQFVVGDGSAFEDFDDH